MKPTIIEGDRIFVNKMAYDFRVPFTRFSLFKRADPVRGDIIIFDSAVSKKRLVKRVIGVPGDVVTLRNNQLLINGQPLPYHTLSSYAISTHKIESLLGVEYIIRARVNGSRLSSFDAIKVPSNQYLALGDNRDESADSRVIGFVPRDEIVGRTNSVVLSFNYDNYYIPRAGRFFQRL